MEDKYQKYKNQPFSSEQWFVLQNAIDSGVDVTDIANTKLTVQQMTILVKAKQNGIDIKGIADPDLTEDQMERFIHKISEEMGIYDEHYEKVRRKWLTNITWMSILAVVITTISLAIYLTKDEWMKYFDDLYLKLTDDIIQIEAGEPFDPAKYVKSYDQESDLKLPDANKVNVTKPGTYKVVYTISNGKKSKNLELIVKVEDTKSPDLMLETDKISVMEANKIDPKKYILYAKDKCDGDLTDKIQFHVSENKIIYEVEDHSKNKARKEISIQYIKKEQSQQETSSNSNNEKSESTKSDNNVNEHRIQTEHQEQKVEKSISEKNEVQNDLMEPQYFPFQDGEDFEEALNRCLLEAKKYSGSISCEPYKGSDDIYEGYVLKSN